MLLPTIEFDQDAVVNNPFLKDCMIYVGTLPPPLYFREQWEFSGT